MDCRSFWAGGSALNVPSNTPTRIFAREIIRPGYDLILYTLDYQIQSAAAPLFVELISGGSSLLSKMLDEGHHALPFLCFPAHGRLDLIMTVPAGPGTISAHVEGYYVPRT
jgi:hypothetical protein